MMSTLSMIKYSHRKKNQFFKKSTALVVVGTLLCSIVLPPYAFTYQRGCISFVEKKSAENHNMRDRSNLIGNIREARKLLLKDSIPHGTPEVVSDAMKELFVAPYREFLDTFNPVQFFKSHRKQTLGQAIGIVLIWGAMVATMIGAPFGIDYLISGSAANHLGITLLSSFIGSLSIVAGIRLSQLASYKSNRTEKIILSIAYLSYPVNVLTHHLFNLISNLTRPLGKWRLQPLKIWRGVKQYRWETRSEGIQNVRSAIAYYRPDIIERYDNINSLSIYARRNLRDEIYKIIQGHLILWGVYAALDRNSAPYFHGSYMNVLMQVFPNLELNPLGFHLNWTTLEQSIESVRFILSRELPTLMERYDRLDRLSDLEIENLRDEIYQIKEGDFTDWGLGDGRKVASFGGGYINALITVFQKLNLNPLGFRLQWETEKEGIESVKFVLSREIPHLMHQYSRLSDLTVREIQDLRNRIYSFKQGHFRLFGLLGVTKQDYFGRSYIGALLRVFNDPGLGLTELEFRKFRRSTFSIKYRWDSIESGIANIRDAFFTNRSDILDRYEHLKELREDEKEALRNELYRISAGHFAAWGIISAMKQNYFNNSHIDALMTVFPDLELNRLGFQLDWSSQDQGKASVRFAISKNRPDLIERYDRLDNLNPTDVRALREEFYKIKNSHFNRWGLSGAKNQTVAPYFKGSYIAAMIATFPNLNLNTLGFFELDWSTEEQSIESIKFVLSREYPSLIQRYERIEELDAKEIVQLREDIYEITQGHFQIWNLGGVLNEKLNPYFNGSYIIALLKLFSNPKLGLTHKGFLEKTVNASAGVSLMTEDTRREAVKRGMNPNSWIAQLFFAPHYEFLDTFNPVQFFKSHREQTLGQAIGIVLIWGAMVATMIGAPFGIDYLISGNSTNHLGITLVTSFIGSLSILAGIRLNQLASYNLNRTEKFILSIAYLSYPVNVLTHHLFNLISNLTRPLGKLRLAPLTKTGVGEDKYEWDTREQGIENVKKGIRKNRPDILKRYENLNQLTPKKREQEEESLRNEIYRITSGHFKVWGLSGAMDDRKVPCFHGSYMNALIAVFPDLNLNPLGFQLDWSNEGRAIESVKYVLSKEVTQIMQQYERIAQLNDREIHDLRNEIYRITSGHFKVWGLGRARDDRKAPYFHGSYIDVLMALFPELNLNPLGFQLDWSNEGRAIESVRYILSKEVPYIMERYQRIAQLNDRELHDLRNEIYGIRQGHFQVWGLSRVMNQESAPYFHGSYINVLISVFNHPRLGLNLQGFQDFRRATFERKYSWGTLQSGIGSVREGIRSNRPDIIDRYENLAQLKDDEIERLKRDIYGITYGHFHVWGLGATMTQKSAPYFHGTHINALIAVFPDLNLNPLGFQLDWSSEEKGIETVRYVLFREAPDMMQRYERINQLDDRDVHDLRNEIYGISNGHFNVWGLGAAMNQKLAPYFHGSHIDVLMALFPDLNLNPLGFQLDWSSKEKGIESVRYVLSKEAPHIMQQYERLDQLNKRDIHDLRNEIYGITHAHFKLWGLGGAMNQRIAPYFHGSYMNALLVVFSHPKLGLNHAGFVEKNENSDSIIIAETAGDEYPDSTLTREQMDNRDSGSPLMTEDTRNEAVKRGMNPNGWIAQLFFAPHYEFLDTFNPVQFFKSHKEQTLGQAIGIILIWGAMVATMIGAPFGIDYLISGSPTNHLGITLLSSFIGSLSIVAGIRLNQLASYKSNRTEKIILSIAYLSYPVNVLTHHLFNLISNLTRPLGKWRLAPLTKIGVDQYEWATREQGVENVRDGIKKNRHDILERYENLNQLTPQERKQEYEALRNEIYRITQGHFNVWGLSVAMNKKLAPYFHGSYMNALMAVFPDLNLNPLGFQLDWSSEERGIESVRYVLSKEVPHIMQQYERIAELNDREIHELRKQIYGITQAHFTVWGLSVPMNQKSAPYFHGSYMNALMAVFPDLNLNPLGFELDWLSEERGIESVKYVLSKQVPHIMQQYERIAELSDREIHDLRNQIYKINQAHFKVWGLDGSTDQRTSPYFYGSYMVALMTVFSDLNLNPLGFQLDWSSKKRGIESVRYVLSKEAPHIMQQYGRIAKLSDREIHDLRNQIYGIKQAHFKVWGLSAAMTHESAPYFHGSYKDILISVFSHPRLGLTLQGINDFRAATFERKYSWGTPGSGIWSVREGIRSNRPDIIVRYENLGELKEDEIERLKRDVYHITAGYFMIWGLGGAMNQKSAPYFHGSYINALMALFPELNLNPLGFQLDWSNEERGLESVKYVLFKEVPHIMQQYERLDQLNETSVNYLRNRIYRITQGHIRVWGLGGAITQRLAPYFHGSYINVLMALFPKLNLNPLGFQLDWLSEERGIESVRYVLSKEVPHIMQQYERIAELNDREIHELRKQIYGITQAHFTVWGLSVPMNQKSAPYFHGSYMNALMAVFPDLNLNPLGFELDWSSKERGIESVKYVLSKEAPHIMRDYERLDQLDDKEMNNLRKRIYELTVGHFQVWGLGATITQKSVPYFHGSYMNVLLEVFPHPKLGLTREGFVESTRNGSSNTNQVTETSESSAYRVMVEIPRSEDSGSNLTIEDNGTGDSASPLMTEDTRNEAVKRGMNPNGWITQLFFAPHYEFLDTFNPVQFFKSHREQTLGQAIGIVLIWGAMVATMIGAPFGIDYLISGNSTNHLGITLVTSFIGSLSILAGIRLNQLASYNLNRTEKFILSIAYLSYPVNVLTHHLFNLISNLTRPLGKWRLAPLTKTGVDPYQWATREQGIENVRHAITNNRPNILERYENLNQLTPRKREQEEESLRKEIYRITSGHFQVWGFGRAMNQESAPYFHGSHIQALILVFPDLNLNPLGFQLDWSSEEKGIESVKYVLFQEIPHIMQQYERLGQLDDIEIHDLKNEIHGITQGHFKAWGLSGAVDQRVAPYFHGSYIAVLMAVFPDLNLNPLGFQLDWSSEEKGIESVKYIFSKEVPHIMQQYERIAKLSEREIHDLRNEIYGIKQAYFNVWGLGTAMNQKLAPYFHGSYKDILISVFNHSKLGLTLQGFQDYRRATYERKYGWGTRESGIWSVREGIRSNRPDIIERYENLAQLNANEIERLKRDIYGITQGHFRVWGFGRAMNQESVPYFHGSYIVALMALFSDLNLNPLGFQLDWSSEKRGIESVKYILSKKVPYIMQQYERLDHLDNIEIHDLKNEIYGITQGHFNVWRLNGAITKQVAPYFQGRHMNALMAVFPDLNLNPLGFQLDWSSEDRGIQSVKYILSREAPHIMRQYERIAQLNDKDVHELRKEIYGITRGHFNIWGLGGAMNQRLAPYFHGSHIAALIAAFSHPKLGLTREGFAGRNENGSSGDSLMTEDTRSEAVKRGMNPNGWITQLFFAPHYEFLDTFNPVQFFKSHSEQTLGQAIGIVLIWGAMVATMIGAPFGIDYIISGSPTNHLGITLVSSFIGSLSIVAGIRLNQLASYNSNRTEKFILSIAYLSYPINVLTHHLFNLISNLTRPLEKWRLAPLTKGTNIYKWEREEDGIENVRDAIRKNRPDILKRYESLNQLTPRQREQEEKSLRNEIYRITSGHFKVWGLSAAMTQESAPYFHGSYITALITVFPELNLNPLGFRLDWSNEERGIESVKYVLSKEVPHIMQQYERISQLNERDMHDLRNKIYGITYGHLKIWGLSAGMTQESAPYFHGSYITALITVFPDLNLNPLGFQLDWSNKEMGIESVEFVLSREVPHLMREYEKIAELNDREVHALRNEIYGIKQAHFKVWGLHRAMDSQKTPYFHGSYKDVLIYVFNHPRLELNLQGFKDFRKATFERKYGWGTRESGIWNVREAIRSNRPDIIESYENLGQLKKNEIKKLRRDIYGITSGHFKAWGLSAAISYSHAPYFLGSHVTALMAVFPDLNLNPLVFRLDWSSEERGIESVRYVLSKEVPHIMRQYKRITQLNDREIYDLRNEIYGITQAHFSVWGLGAAMTQESAPYFHGSYTNILMAVFPELNLNPLGFQLDWSSEDKGIESVRYVLSKEAPHIMRQYERITQLNDREVHDLRNEIYVIEQGHFTVWGLGGAIDNRKAPYFHGSYMNALMAVFPHSKLGLTREGFVERTGNGATDILEPLVQPQSRFKTWKAKAAYYLFVGSWEEVIYRWGGLVGLPLLLSLYGFDSVLISYFGLDINMGQILGVVWSSAGFLFSHTIVRWLAKRKSVDWDGWKMELKKDFLSLKSFHTLLYNLLFISIISFQPSLVSFALLSVSSLHFTIDMLDAYKKKRLTSQELLSQEMQLIADKLGTSQPELQHLSLDSNLNFSSLVQTLFAVWSKDTKGSELYLVDLTGSRDKASQIAMLRTIHEIYGLNQNARFILVMDEPKPIEELEAILGIQGILFAVSNAEDAIKQTKALLKQGSYAVRLIAASNKIGIWSNLMDELGKTVRGIHILVLQILDVGVTIKIVLPRDKFFNAGIEEWVRDLEGRGRIERNGRELTIQGVELEPPSFKEDHQLHTLFSSQA